MKFVKIELIPYQNSLLHMEVFLSTNWSPTQCKSKKITSKSNKKTQGLIYHSLYIITFSTLVKVCEKEVFIIFITLQVHFLTFGIFRKSVLQIQNNLLEKVRNKSKKTLKINQLI